MADQAIVVGLASGCLIWVPLGVWIIALVGWIIQGEVDALGGIAGILIALVMGGMAWVSPEQAPYLLIGALSIVILFPIARALKDKRELAQIDLHQLERAYEQLSLKPDNVGAKIKIAKTLYDRGAHEHAAAVVEKAIKGLPKQIYEEEHRLVKQWRRGLVSNGSGELPCVVCNAKNKPGELFCYRCGAPFLLHYAKGHWVHPSVIRRLLVVWMAAMISIVGIPLTASKIPMPQSIPVVALLVCITSFMLWLTLKKWRKA